MKGIELLSSLISILMMIGVSGLLAGVIIAVLNAAGQPSSSQINYEMQLSPIYPPIKHEAMLLSYLESTDPHGFQIKKILTYAALQENITNVFVDGVEITDLADSSSKIIDYWIPNEAFVLALDIEGKPFVIAQNDRAFQILPNGALAIKRISIPLYIDSSSVKKVIGSTNEFQLNVTLDFYVL